MESSRYRIEHLLTTINSIVDRTENDEKRKWTVKLLKDVAKSVTRLDRKKKVHFCCCVLACKS